MAPIPIDIHLELQKTKDNIHRTQEIPNLQEVQHFLISNYTTQHTLSNLIKHYNTNYKANWKKIEEIYCKPRNFQEIIWNKRKDWLKTINKIAYTVRTWDVNRQNQTIHHLAVSWNNIGSHQVLSHIIQILENSW